MNYLMMKYVKIISIIITFNLLYGQTTEEIMEENKEKLREMSLRMVNKIADLKKMAPERWMRLAESTCMKRN